MLMIPAHLSAAGAACYGIAAFAAGAVPFYLLVEVEHLTPACVKRLPSAVSALANEAALTAAVLLLLLSAPKGASR